MIFIIIIITIILTYLNYMTLFKLKDLALILNLLLIVVFGKHNYVGGDFG